MQSREFRGCQEILSCPLIVAAWTLGVRGQEVGGECEGREGMRPGGKLPARAMNMLGKWPNRRPRAASLGGGSSWRHVCQNKEIFFLLGSLADCLLLFFFPQCIYFPKSATFGRECRERIDLAVFADRRWVCI